MSKLLLQLLKDSENNSIENKELKQIFIENSGCSKSTFERVKKELIENNEIEVKITGKGKERTSTITLKE